MSNFPIDNTTYLQNLAFNTVSNTFDVSITDQTTDAIIVNFNQIQESTTLSVASTIDDKTITLTNVSGVTIGTYIILFDPGSLRFSTFYVTESPAGNVVSIDGPMDFDYPIGTFVDITTTNMNVDGSTTPQIFGLRGLGIIPGVEITLDVTRLMFGMKCDTAIDLDKFGDLTKLVNGVQIRSRNHRYKNILNWKSNGELATFDYDWSPYSATNPQQGQDGFVSRLTFAGQNKIGVAIRLPLGEDLEIIIQDDLTNLDRFIIIAEGHITN